MEYIQAVPEAVVDNIVSRSDSGVSLAVTVAVVKCIFSRSVCAINISSTNGYGAQDCQ